MDSPARSGRSESGQASVELVAVIPFVLLVGAVVWQLALAGHALWVTAHAARAAARADAVGKDVGAAARSALPRGLERGLRVKRLGGGGVRVRVRMPLFAHRWPGPVTMAATSSLGRGPHGHPRSVAQTQTPSGQPVRAHGGHRMSAETA